MKTDGSETPQTTLSRVQSSKFESPGSSKLKLTGIGKSRKLIGKNLTSMLLQERQMIRIVDGDVEITPKLLTHPTFSSIEGSQMTAFDIITSSHTTSAIQLVSSASGLSSLVTNSSTVIRTSSLPSGSMVVSADEAQFESLFSTQIEDDVVIQDEDKAPSQFYLPSIDPNIFLTRPETVTIVLRETETFFLFEMQPRTGDLREEEGLAIKQENENYEYKTVGPGSNRKLVDAETQTIQLLTKSRGTYLGRRKRRNRGMLVNNWMMNDTYDAPHLMVERNNMLIAHTTESMERMLQAEV